MGKKAQTPAKGIDKIAERSEVSLGELKAVGAEAGDHKEIRIAIAGLGNCASALAQGIEYYRDIKEEDMYINGLMNPSVGGYLPKHMKIVAAFEVNALKIGKDVAEAIYCDPITTPHFVPPEKYPRTGTVVQAGPVLDGVAPHMRERFHVYEDGDPKVKPCDVVQVLKDAKAEILVNYCPVGSFKAARFYAQAALDAGCGFINCIPEFIVSERVAGDKDWVAEFKARGLPCAGDDIKSQVGATIMHRMLAKLFLDRGVIVKDTYQLNIGGDTDFENMKMESRLVTKRKSKTSAVTSVLPYETKCRIGPSDFVPFLLGKKICYIRMNGVTFGGVPLEVDVKMRVEDAPNSAGVVFDIIRVMKLALNRKLSGRLDSIASFSFKHPPIQPPSDVIAKQWVAEFIEGKRER
ncbi:MAG: inositol-3-phosphate synthase [Candidatus Lokiarchaeota archaeon]|nr:inositol-3-phosphate synthase [Candidatus Lokiarchaeota archaeon]